MARLFTPVLAAALIGLPAAALAEPSADATTKAPAAKKICKSRVEIGSLVKRKKECFTAHEWDRIAEAATLGARDIVDRSMGTPMGGN